MTPPSTQDVQKPFDPTGYSSITGAALAQYADGLTPYADKGLIVITTDVATVPTVPNALVTTKWKNYIWVRRQATSVTAYVWNENAAADITLSYWVSISVAALGDGSVTNSKIGTGAVTNDKIFSVDWTKLTGIPATLMLGGITAAGGDLTGLYPNPTIAANAVTSTKLQSDATVDANRAVGTDHIKDASVTAAKLDATAQAKFCPSGSVVMFGGNVAPTGWLECNGDLVSRGTFAALFAAIGTSYGAGDGVTTFQLPDMRGYFPRGWDHGAGVDAGRGIGGAVQADAIKDHKHNPLAPSTAFLGADGSGPSTTVGGAVYKDTATTGLVTAPNNGGTETRPKNVTFMFVIKS